MKKKVSCICPTHGRYPEYKHLVEECVASFLQQDYKGPKELIILNDCINQNLVTNIPDIRIINWPYWISSLGEKYNILCKNASGSIIFPWEDDDISLPHRISQGIDFLFENYDYFNPQHSFYHDGKTLHVNHRHGVCHNASCFTRDAWIKVGGYSQVSGNQDFVMDVKLKSLNKTAPALNNDIRSWSYIYCWQRGFHLSGQSDLVQAYRNYGNQKFTSGTFLVESSILGYNDWLDKIALL